MRALLCSALLALTACAAAPATHAGSLVDLAVVDRDTGETLRTYSNHGKIYVAGMPGHRYSVRMNNRTGGRVLTVLSVDGVNAITGQTASASQSGYVLSPWESAEIAGWRKSDDEIAQFNFTSLPDSYAARTGRPANVGVIGVAVFTERTHWREREDDLSRNEAPAPPPAMPASEGLASRAQAPAADAKVQTESVTSSEIAPIADKRAAGAVAKQERLGTGHGAREYSHIDTTTFERATSWPAEQVAIYYDSYRNLVAQGIIERPIARQDPQPFPNGFVPDPPAR